VIPFTYDWIIPGEIMASSIPNSEADIQTVRGLGIRAIVSLARRPITCHAGITEDLLRDLDMKWQHSPIDDGGVPANWMQAVDILTFMLIAKKEGRPILFHCRWGIARTGVIVWHYLRSQGWPTAVSLPMMYARRISFDGATRLGPCNDVQRAWCGGWCDAGGYHERLRP
jgi:protein-tyrosine phosphatase